MLYYVYGIVSEYRPTSRLLSYGSQLLLDVLLVFGFCKTQAKHMHTRAVYCSISQDSGRIDSALKALLASGFLLLSRVHVVASENGRMLSTFITFSQIVLIFPLVSDRHAQR